MQKDKSFLAENGLEAALNLLRTPTTASTALPAVCPDQGIGELATLDLLAPHVFGRSAHLNGPNALAHMDPPTPWVTWATTLWNASLNQNLLHPATAPFAIEAEKLVINWLTPFFGMRGGHFCSGSTLANLTALWAARDAQHVSKVVASASAHLSIKKAAHILGLPFVAIPTNALGQLDPNKLPDLTNACLVLTAGTTATGAIDPLNLIGQAKWTHVDAAWAGPLRLSEKHRHLLEGVESADSIAISAHKWFFQPKDSALILFREPELANPAISFGGGYLTTPNIGVQGSRGAAAIPLLATLLAWGKNGLAQRIDHAMSLANTLATAMYQTPNIALWAMPTTGVTVFRPLNCSTNTLYNRLPDGMLSTCILDNQRWLRSVAANPTADIQHIITTIQAALPA